MWEQLNLLALIQQEKPVVTAPTKEASPAPPKPTIPSYSITHNPLKGFKVVMAPGLTTRSPSNPCLGCDSFGQDMEKCSINCKHASERKAYLHYIGVTVISAVDAECGAYGI
jgi:hypothetical protein